MGIPASLVGGYYLKGADYVIAAIFYTDVPEGEVKARIKKLISVVDKSALFSKSIVSTFGELRIPERARSKYVDLVANIPCLPELYLAS